MPNVNDIARPGDVPHPYERGFVVPALVIHGVPVTGRDLLTGKVAELAERINVAARAAAKREGRAVA